MSLLKNAVDAILLGLEDYSSTQDKRMLSAVRNLNAGILLLFKEKLRRLSPPGTEEFLMKAKHEFRRGSNGEIVTVGKGRNTVDVPQIEERFKTLGVHTDWVRFNKVYSLRKDIEHLYTTQSRGAIQGMISDTFIIIRDFIHSELQEDAKELLGDEAWAKLVSVTEVYESERKDCEEALKSINWKSDALAAAVLELRCAECGSALLFPLGKTKECFIQCRSCGEDESFEHYAVRAISDYFAGKNYYSIKDGGDPASTDCPHCGLEGYIVEENRCVICEESCETTCSVCSQSIPVSELSDGSVCGYCYHKSGKDD